MTTTADPAVVIPTESPFERKPFSNRV